MDNLYPTDITEVENDRKPLVSITNRPKDFFIKGNLVLLAFLAGTIYFGRFIIMCIILMIAANLMVYFAPDHRVIDIYEDFLVIYDPEDQQKCRVFRNEEILTWRILNDENGSVEIVTGEQDVFHFETSNDRAVYHELMKVLPEQSETHQKMKKLMERQQQSDTLISGLTEKVKSKFKK